MSESALTRLERIVAEAEAFESAGPRDTVTITLELAKGVAHQVRAAVGHADVERLVAKASDPMVGELGTKELPEGVVSQELVVSVWLTTDEDNPRRGTMAYGVWIGGRDNPPLTRVEAEYVARALEYGAAKVRGDAAG